MLISSNNIIAIAFISSICMLVQLLAKVRYLYLTGVQHYWLGLIPFVNTWKLYGTLEESTPGKVKLVRDFEVPAVLIKLNWIFSLLVIIPSVGIILGWGLITLCKYKLYKDSYEYLSSSNSNVKRLAVLTLFIWPIWPIKVFLTDVNFLSDNYTQE